MNIATTAPPTTPAPAGLDALLPATGNPAGADGVSAFLDMLGLLNGLAAPAEAEAPTAEVEAAQDTAEADAAPAMPAMLPLPAQLVMAVPVVPVVPESAAEPLEAAADDTTAPLAPTPTARRDTPAPQTAVPVALPPQVMPMADAPVRAAALPVVDEAAPVRAAATAAEVPPADTRKAATFHLDDVAAPVTAPVAAGTDDFAAAPALKLAPGTPTQWRQPLAEALGDRLQLSLQRGSDQAVIRLEPPQLGRIEIAIRHEAGSLQVHLSATHGEVVRQLNAIGDTMRQDLGQRQYGDVSVVVSDAGAMARDADGRSRGRQPQQDEQAPNRALAEAESGQALAFRLADNTSDQR